MLDPKFFDLAIILAGAAQWVILLKLLEVTEASLQIRVMDDEVKKAATSLSEASAKL